MKSKDRDPENALQRALAEMRSEEIDSTQTDQAASRVWSQLNRAWNEQSSHTAASGDPSAPPAETIRHCADFQSLIPAYLSGRLSTSHTLLLEDHTHACVPCRKALRDARSVSPQAAPVVSGPSSPRHATKRMLAWGIAAAVLLSLGLTQWGRLKALFFSPGEVYAMAQSVDGTVFRVYGHQTRPIAVGDRINRQEKIRTAKNSRAMLQLADGSRIEMRERSELSLAARRDGAAVELERGDVIISAAKQRSGHLYLSTRDCLVSVTGTIFSVNRGTKGSRVSVIEGEVWVEHGKSRNVLHPGQQFATYASLGAVPLEQEIAWSKDADSHLALLRAFSALRKDIQKITSGLELRYHSKLLPIVPEGAVIYAAFPNISATLGGAYDIFQQRINENPALHQWWNETMRASGGKPALEDIMSKIRLFGDFLGDEIVLVVPRNAADDYAAPLVLAEVRRSGDFLTALRAEIARWRATSGAGAPLRVIEDPAELSTYANDSPRPRELFLLAQDSLIAASPDPRSLQTLAQQRQNPRTPSPSGRGFYSRIARAYADGVGWLFAADLETILSADAQKHRKSSHGEKDYALFRRTGFSDIQHFIVEQKSLAGVTENQAVLSFNQPRRGMAAWLAEPGPMGALEFVSPDAVGVTAFVIKDPMMIVDELFGLVQDSDAKAWQDLLDFQSQHGVNVRADIAAPLGGEFLFAVDGPLLPTPSWKVVVEVYHPERLQKTLDWAVATYNQEAGQTGQPVLRLTREDVDGRTFYRLACAESGYEAHYVFWDGYLVAAPSRALLVQSLQYRASGYTLTRSPGFNALLPDNGRAHASALIYQNVSSVIGSLAQYIPEAGTKQRPSPAKSLAEVASQVPPMLLCIYGEKDRIILANKGQLGLHLGALAGFESLQRLISATSEAPKIHPKDGKGRVAK